jgi:hypothetical protein
MNLLTPTQWEVLFTSAPPGAREEVNAAHDAFIEAHGKWSMLEHRVYFRESSDREENKKAAFDAWCVQSEAFRTYVHLCEMVAESMA